MAAQYTKFKIHGKDPKKKKTPPAVDQKTNTESVNGVQKNANAPLTAADNEVVDEINKLHTFMTQRCCPYLVVAQTPDTKFPVWMFSYNHEHNKPEQNNRNAEWLFCCLGQLLDHSTGGLVEIVRRY